MRTVARIILLIFLVCPITQAESLRIAVASNFKPVMQLISHEFSALHQINLVVSSGSSGTIFAQIVHGAPFDVFLSADSMRPLNLEERDLTIAGSRSVYAIGRLVLWVPKNKLVEQSSLQRLNTPLAIANPILAPYGAAAMQVLTSLSLESKTVVTGNSVNQAFSFVATGNAKAGLVSLSQMNAAKVSPEQYWLISTELHQPIRQELVALKNANVNHKLFLAFMQSTIARNIISNAGYDLPSRNQWEKI